MKKKEIIKGIFDKNDISEIYLNESKFYFELFHKRGNTANTGESILKEIENKWSKIFEEIKNALPDSEYKKIQELFIIWLNKIFNYFADNLNKTELFKLTKMIKNINQKYKDKNIKKFWLN